MRSDVKLITSLKTEKLMKPHQLSLRKLCSMTILSGTLLYMNCKRKNKYLYIWKLITLLKNYFTS